MPSPTHNLAHLCRAHTRTHDAHRFVLSEIVPVRVPNLRTKFPPSNVPNLEIASDSQGGATHYTKLIGEDDVVIYGEFLFAFSRIRPRPHLHALPVKSLVGLCLFFAAVMDAVLSAAVLREAQACGVGL